MSKCTKGKLEAIGNTIYRKQTYIGECLGYFQKSILGDEVDEANAKELVRRWNAFEDGGIVEELRKACKEALSLVESDYRGHSDWVGPGVTLGPKLEAALAKS